MGIIYVLVICSAFNHYKKINMAEIHVQAKKRGSSAWLWILISIIILGTIAFILLWNNSPEVREKFSKPNQTSMIFQQDTGIIKV